MRWMKNSAGGPSTWTGPTAGPARGTKQAARISTRGRMKWWKIGGKENSMNIWRTLDLRSKISRPEEKRLTALYLVDRRSGHAEYRIGCLTKKRGSNTKLWWEDASGVQDLARLRSRYDIQWSYVDPCGPLRPL